MAAPSAHGAESGRERTHRGVTIGLGLLTAALVVPVGMILLSLRTYELGNSRDRLNGYLMTHTVVVDAEPEAVFDFSTYRMDDYNLSIARRTSASRSSTVTA